MFGKNGSLLGVACEHGRLSLALVKQGVLKQSVWEEIPENIVEGSEIVSRNLFAAFLKETMAKNHISCKNVAYSLPDRKVLTRFITMPKMSEDQIRLNIPFEFRDFISGELKEYVFDYAYQPPKNQAQAESESSGKIRLFAAALSRNDLNEADEMFKMAGLRMKKAAPRFCAFEALLRLLPTPDKRERERCFLDIGNKHSQMMIFKDGRYKLVHMIDIGEHRIIQAVADEKNVDMHIAKTYLEENYEDCQNLPSVVNVYKDISIEVLKGINYYEVSDMSSNLQDITICGLGATIQPLVGLLRDRLSGRNMNANTMGELLPEWNKDGLINVTASSLGQSIEQ